jgi:hypothetical protein
MYAFTTQSGRYHVEVHGNGWGYAVTDQTTGDNLWFQDDDAVQLQADTNDFEFEDSINNYFECLCE